MSSNNFNTSLFELDALSHFESPNYADFVSDLPVADYESYQYDASLSTILESTFSEVEEYEVQGVDESVSFDLAQYLASVPAVDRLLDTSTPLEILQSTSWEAEAFEGQGVDESVSFDLAQYLASVPAVDKLLNTPLEILQPTSLEADAFEVQGVEESVSFDLAQYLASVPAVDRLLDTSIPLEVLITPAFSDNSMIKNVVFDFPDSVLDEAAFDSQHESFVQELQGRVKPQPANRMFDMYSVAPEAGSIDDSSFSSTAAEHDFSADISFSTPPVSTQSRFTAIANMYSVVPEADCTGDDVSFSSTAADHDLSTDISFATLAESCSSTKRSSSNDISFSSIVADHDLSTDTPFSTLAETSFFPDTPSVVSEKVPISLVTEILNSSKDCKVTKVETLSRTFVILEVVR